MSPQADTVSQGMYCLTVAATGAITDWSDVKVRGYLKEHPGLVDYRLGLLQRMIDEVRAQVRAEELKWRRDQVANGWAPPDPDAEHHEQVAEYVAHQGCCPHCLICGGHPADAEDPYLDDDWEPGQPVIGDVP